MAKQVEQLKLDDEHATAIVELGIEYEAYESDLPKTKKDRLAAAQEVITFCIDAVVSDNYTPDNEDPEIAEDSVKIAEILELAGIEIDEDKNIEYGDPPDLDAAADEDESEDDEEDEADDDEAPFDPDDYLDGYTEMRVSEKVKAIRDSLEPDNDDDVATLEALAEWENEQDKPSSRVLNTIEEMLAEVEGEEDEDEESDDSSDDAEAEAESGEPWDGYDKMTAAEVKKVLGDLREDEEDPLTAEQVEFVMEYELSRKAPRKRVVTYCEELLASFNGEDEEEEKPKGLAARRKKQQREPEVVSNGVIVLTREQILAALADGTVEIEV